MGLVMAFRPGTIAYRPAHVHANLVGFVSMMIFGVAYHIMPRFSGRPLHSPRLAAVHLIIANAGLAVMVAGWIVRVHWAPIGAALVGAGGVLTAVGTFTFIYNIWRTLDTASVRVTALSQKGKAS